MPYSPYSDYARSQKWNSYIDNESLFLYLCETLEEIERPKLKYTKIEMWADAKELAQNILTIKHPEFRINDILYPLGNEFKSYSCNNRDDKHIGVYYTTDISNRDSNHLVQSVILALYAILYSQYKLREDRADLSKLIYKMKAELKMDESFNIIEQYVDEGIEKGEVIIDYDYAKDEEQQQQEEEEVVNDCVTFERKDSKGQKITKTITAREISDIVMKYHWKEGMKKEDMQKMLSEITGLSLASFQNKLTE